MLQLTQSEKSKLTTFVLIFACIGALGALMRVYDFLFLRGLDYSAGLGAARLENMRLVEEAGAGTNYLSAISRSLIGFSSVAAMLVFLRFEQFKWDTIRIALLSFATVLGASALEGGRNTIAVNFVLIASCIITRKALGKRGLPEHKNLKRAINIGVLLSLALLSYIWIDRLEAVGHEGQAATAALETVFDMKFADWISQLQIDGVGGILFTLVGIVFYVIHGVNQMNWLVGSIDSQHLSLGSYNFDLPALALQSISGWNVRFDPSVLERVGVYMTAIGELYIDFGFEGTLLALLAIGYLMGSVWSRMKSSNSVASELLNAWGVAGILVSPLYSILAGFFGVLAVMLLFAVLFGHGRTQSGLSRIAPVPPHTAAES